MVRLQTQRRKLVKKCSDSSETEMKNKPSNVKKEWLRGG